MGIDSGGRCPCADELSEGDCSLGAGTSFNSDSTATSTCTIAQTLVAAASAHGPLEVEDPTFVLKRIGQQTTFPGAENVISMTLAMNIAVETKLEAKVTLSGLTGTAPTPWAWSKGADGNNLEITSPQLREISGEWNSASHKLEFQLEENLEPFKNYSFAFSVRNALNCGSACGTAAATKIELHANKGSCRKAREDFVCPSPVCENRPCILVNFAQADLIAAPGDLAPMLLDQPKFLVKSIGDNTNVEPFPGTVNTITVSLSFNVELTAPTQLVFSGLRGGTVTDVTHLGSSGGADLFDTTGAKDFTFDASQSSLTLSIRTSGLRWAKSNEKPERGRELSNVGLAAALKLKSDQNPSAVIVVFSQSEWNFGISELHGEDYVEVDSYYFTIFDFASTIPGRLYKMQFAFDLSMNPQDSPEVFVSTRCRQGQTCAVTLDSELMDGKVLKIDEPKFLMSKTGQSSSHPGAENDITITLKPNTELKLARKVRITISGMFGGTASGADMVLAGGTWISWEQSTLVVELDSEVDPTTSTQATLEIEVRVINSKAPQPPPVLQVC